MPASSRLPERQRDVLALREEGLSYEEIATKLETTPDRVGQLLAHAWINLYDEEVGTVLASVAPTPDCERALGLIAARHDGELEVASPDGEWLEAHLTSCHRCRRGVSEMGEMRSHFRSGGRDVPARHRRLATARVGVAAGLLALLAGAGLAMALVGGEPTSSPVEPVVGAAAAPRAAGQGPGTVAGERNAERERRAARKRRREALARSGGEEGPVAATRTTAAAPGSIPTDAAGGGDGGAASQPRNPTRSSGQVTLQPPRPVSTPAPKPRPDPAPVTAVPATTTGTASPTPAPTPETEAVPNGNAPAHSNRPTEPPGKAAGHSSG
ncbi:MAG TPA: sigma factor-like helix-turn-helix DNA-binding protein [Solirubrobacterales bacterium]|nr:sigma factor-like helix-turn-helix DNA-binding protein [Solirubrobacterales bacterium]